MTLIAYSTTLRFKELFTVQQFKTKTCGSKKINAHSTTWSFKNYLKFYLKVKQKMKTTNNCPFYYFESRQDKYNKFLNPLITEHYSYYLTPPC